MRRVTRRALALALTLLVLGGVLTSACVRRVPVESYDVCVAAAERLERCMARVKEYKEALGIPLSEEDWHETGMIGEEYTLITTTLGAVEAKRTTANPDMAALCVRLLEQAGIEAGDTVGAGFSGSFPAMDLAVLCACEAMGVRIVYIASAGASTYGANQPELTLPDMVCRLAREGYLSQMPAALSMGGDFDCGEEMFPEVREELRTRLEDYGVLFLSERDYRKNLALREEIYEREGPIDCFIGVGGNVTTTGLDGDRMDWGVSEPESVKTVSEKSGLLERYNAAGLPVIYLLNIKKLVSEYGLAYDPQTLPPIGESAVYYRDDYPVAVALCGAAAACTVLIASNVRERKREEA